MKTALVLLFTIVLFIPANAHAASNAVIENIWNFPYRATAQISSWIAPSSVTPIVEEQVLGSSNLADQPVLEVSDTVPNLLTKLESSKATLERLALGYQQVLGESVLIGLKWDNLTVADVTQSIDKQNAILNDSTQSFDLLSKAWGWPMVDTLRAKTNTIKVNLASIRNITSQSGTLTIGYEQLKETAKAIEEIVTDIGEITDTEKVDTLYSKYNQVQNLAVEWDSLTEQINQKIINSDDLNLSKLTKQVLDLNTIPNISSFISKDPRNKKYDLLGIIEVNKMLMALDRGSVVSHTWLGEGDKVILFKTLVTNPSLLARKEVPVRFYLPVELSQENVHLEDSNLQLRMDEGRKQLYIEGSVVVAANDTRLIVISTDDVWNFDLTQAATTRQQMQELVTAVANNPNLGKMLELKIGIENQLRQIEQLESKVLAPEERIQRHRQMGVLLDQVHQDLVKMQNLSNVSAVAIGSKYSQWQDAAIGVVGMMFVILGLSMFSDFKTKPVWAKRPKHSPKSFSVFSSNIASSDM